MQNAMNKKTVRNLKVIAVLALKGAALLIALEILDRYVGVASLPSWVQHVLLFIVLVGFGLLMVEAKDALGKEK